MQGAQPGDAARVREAVCPGGSAPPSRESSAGPSPTAPPPFGADGFGIVRRSADGDELDAWEMVQVQSF